MSIIELQDIIECTWQEIAAMSKGKDRHEKIKQYNVYAQEYNNRVGFESMTIITASTKVEVPLKETHTQLEPVAHKISGKGKIEQIISLHEQGLTNAEIVEKGFNKSTVNRQISEYKKRK